MKQRVTAPILALVAILLVSACSSGTIPTATTTPLPPPTVLPGFSTFTDESETFSIQYPSSWLLNQSTIEPVWVPEDGNFLFGAA